MKFNPKSFDDFEIPFTGGQLKNFNKRVKKLAVNPSISLKKVWVALLILTALSTGSCIIVAIFVRYLPTTIFISLLQCVGLISLIGSLFVRDKYKNLLMKRLSAFFCFTVFCLMLGIVAMVMLINYGLGFVSLIPIAAFFIVYSIGFFKELTHAQGALISWFRLMKAHGKPTLRDVNITNLFFLFFLAVSTCVVVVGFIVIAFFEDTLLQEKMVVPLISTLAFLVVGYRCYGESIGGLVFLYRYHRFLAKKDEKSA